MKRIKGDNMQNEILNARENRWNTRLMLIEKFSLPVISITMNIPGCQKVRDDYIRVYNTVVEHFTGILESNGFVMKYKEHRVGADGQETFIVVEEDAYKLKELSIQAEEKHPLGRLVDIDILDWNKNNISRKDLGIAERKCIVCGEAVHPCIVGRRHSVDEVLTSIDKIIRNYYKKG
jgi:holo-ACP synthase